MGFFFDARFEPNLLITVRGVLCALALTELSSCRAVLAGLGCGLSIMAKLTFAPITLALAAYLLITRRSLLFPFNPLPFATTLSSSRPAVPPQGSSVW
jgi:hypothetical protein